MGKPEKSLHYFLVIVVHVTVSVSTITDIKLTGFSTKCAGRVEIQDNNNWTLVCSNNWDMNDAEVVCRELKCGKALSVNHSAHLGLETGHFYSYNFSCSGSESRLTDCHQNWTQNCDYRKAAGVICSELLQQPNISLTSPDGGLVWIDRGAEVTTGYSFVITCSTNFNIPGRFILIGPVSNESKELVNQSASFNIPVADYKHQGNYSCVYELQLSPGKFMYTESEPIHVIVTLPWLLLITSVVAGSVLLFLLVLLVVCLLLKRRKQCKLSATGVETQMTHINSADNSEGEEGDYVNIDEEEGDYVNVQPGEATKQTAPAEEGEDSDSHDYERMDNNMNCATANVIYISATNCKEEEDDENDYVNLAESIPEECVDIYGDDVYQNF